MSDIKYIDIPLEYNKKIINKTSSARVYTDATILTPGEWSDSVTQAPVVYEEAVLRKYATNWESNYLNVDHSFRTLDRIGYVENAYFSKGKVKADLRILPVTQKARDTIALIDAGLANNVSVEIKTEDVWKSEEMKRYVDKITFIGLAVVLYPACEQAIINE